MQLQAPFEITHRLMAGMRIGDAWLSIGYAGRSTDGRAKYRYHIDLPDGSEYTGDDLRSGVGQRPGLQEMFGTLLAFLGAAGEAMQYAERTGRESENADLFPLAVAQWAAQNSDELSCLQFDLEESGETFITE